MKACKNIWIFNHYAVTPDLPGITRHFDFAQELTNRGYKITIFASAFIHELFRERKSQKTRWRLETYSGVNFVWIKTPRYNKNNWKRAINILSYSWNAYFIGRKLPEQDKTVFPPSIIIGSSFHPLAAFIAYKLSQFYNVPFILEVRDLYPQSLIDLNMVSSNNILTKIIRSFMIYLYKHADKIIILMPNAYSLFGSIGINKEKVIWIPNGINLHYLENTTTNLMSTKDNHFKVMFAGSLNNANSIETLLLAARIVQNSFSDKIFFEVYGKGKEEAHLLHLKESLGLHNFRFCGSVPKSNIYKVLSNANVLWAGQKKKNVYKYGISFNKLFDYLAVGKPIVFSSNASNNPVAEAQAGLTVPPENPQAVAEAIINLYNMKEEERDQMGKNGRKYVEKNYSIFALTDKLEKVINETCKDNIDNKY